MEIELSRTEGNGYPVEYEEIEAPITVTPIKILKTDARALKEISHYDNPPLREVRCNSQTSVFLGDGDASGRGFGGILFLHYMYGQ